MYNYGQKLTLKAKLKNGLKLHVSCKFCKINFLKKGVYKILNRFMFILLHLCLLDTLNDWNLLIRDLLTKSIEFTNSNVVELGVRRPRFHNEVILLKPHCLTKVFNHILHGLFSMPYYMGGGVGGG